MRINPHQVSELTQKTPELLSEMVKAWKSIVPWLEQLPQRTGDRDRYAVLDAAKFQSYDTLRGTLKFFNAHTVVYRADKKDTFQAVDAPTWYVNSLSDRTKAKDTGTYQDCGISVGLVNQFQAVAGAVYYPDRETGIITWGNDAYMYAFDEEGQLVPYNETLLQIQEMQGDLNTIRLAGTHTRGRVQERLTEFFDLVYQQTVAKKIAAVVEGHANLTDVMIETSATMSGHEAIVKRAGCIAVQPSGEPIDYTGNTLALREFVVGRPEIMLRNGLITSEQAQAASLPVPANP